MYTIVFNINYLCYPFLKSSFTKVQEQSNKCRKRMKECLTWHRRTPWKRVTAETRYTNTHWCMVDNTTVSISSTWSWARISASIVLTCPVTGTFCIYCTFWTTIRCSSDVIRLARTCGHISNDTTLWIRATRGRHTRSATRNRWIF